MDFPALSNSDHPDIVNTQTFIETFPCLWLRGILPLCFSTVPDDMLPPECTDHWLYNYSGQELKTGEWPVGVYGTDGSGGKYGSIPTLRRCVCGIAKFNNDRTTVSFGLSFALPGKIQTVPRSELMAICTVIRLVQNGWVEIVSDSKINVDMFYKPRSSKFSLSLI